MWLLLVTGTRRGELCAIRCRVPSVAGRLCALDLAASAIPRADHPLRAM